MTESIREMVTLHFEQLAELNILIKEKNQLYAEPSYRLNPEFMFKLDDHFKIQEAIELMDKQNGIDSSLDYGGLSREHYVMGITIKDFTKVTPKDCKKCKSIMLKGKNQPNSKDSIEEFLKERHDSTEQYMEHMKTEHGDLYEIQQNQDKFVMNWILIIEEMIKGNTREWRSKI